MYPSISEDHALDYLMDSDRKILSVGISTAGNAEIRMANSSTNRNIIATTIDREGALFTEKLVEEAGLSRQITVKVEDVKDHLPYSSNCFDFIYARLVLHYLPQSSLKSSLSELRRVLKDKGKIFVVVRSRDSKAVSNKRATYDPETKLTTYTNEFGCSTSRFFHDIASIQDFLKGAGFKILHTKTYEELFCSDFKRKHLKKMMLLY